MAGYSLGDADILRRAMGKKKKEVMVEQQKRFIAGAEKKEIKSATAKKVFELMAYFAGYGFNKSHSAAYALVAYHTAWLKAHHPSHFMAALLTNDKGNTEKLVKYKNDCNSMGITVSPPNINLSQVDFGVDGDRIVYGMSAIKNVGEGAIRTILSAREEGGAFESLHELCGRVDSSVSKRVLEALTHAGALDSFGARRSQLVAIIEPSMDYGQKIRADREAGQASLFGGPTTEEQPVALPMPDIPEWDEKTLLNHEKASLGFYVSGHPLDPFKDLLNRFTTHRSGNIGAAATGCEVVLGGVITALSSRKSKKGAMWASMQLEDLEGRVDVLVFPKAYELCSSRLENDLAVMVKGKLNIDEERVRVFADDVGPLDELRRHRVGAVQVRLDAGTLDEDLIDRLRLTLDDHRGEVDVLLEIARPGSYRIVARAEAAMRVAPSDRFDAAIESLIGPDRLVYRAKPNEKPS
jgi:DNA polymerase-3 subunit alpha